MRRSCGGSLAHSFRTTGHVPATTEPEFERSGTLASLNTRDSQDAIYIAFRAAAGAKKVPVPERLRFTVTRRSRLGAGSDRRAAAFVAGAALANEMLEARARLVRDRGGGDRARGTSG